MNDRPGWIQLLYERHTASYALHTAFLLKFVNGLIIEEADAQPSGREKLRQVALSELDSPDRQVVAMSLLFLGMVGQAADLPTIRNLVAHECDSYPKNGTNVRV